MMQSRRPRKTQTNLSPALHRNLNAYALAASAAGVSMLALAQTSQAEIIYTPTHATIGRHGSYRLDVNNDGQTDFIILERAATRPFGTVQSLFVDAPKGNDVKCSACAFTSRVFAAALSAGNRIGGGSSTSFSPYGGAAMVSDASSKGTVVFYNGPWVSARDRYLGLKFHLQDGEHYGWARLSVDFQGNANPQQRTWRAVITGYAYETTPFKPIEAGQIKEKSGAPVEHDSAMLGKPAPVSGSLPLSPKDALALGALALGSDGIALWRREE